MKVVDSSHKQQTNLFTSADIMNALADNAIAFKEAAQHIAGVIMSPTQQCDSASNSNSNSNSKISSSLEEIDAIDLSALQSTTSSTSKGRLSDLIFCNAIPSTSDSEQDKQVVTASIRLLITLCARKSYWRKGLLESILSRLLLLSETKAETEATGDGHNRLRAIGRLACILIFQVSKVESAKASELAFPNDVLSVLFTLLNDNILMKTLESVPFYESISGPTIASLVMLIEVLTRPQV
jgi:hypothetical protein